MSNVKKYRTQPRQIVALRVDYGHEDLEDDLTHFVSEDTDGNPLWRFTHDEGDIELWVRTSGGGFVICPDGSYLMIDEAGFPYPCDPDVFDARYRPMRKDRR